MFVLCFAACAIRQLIFGFLSSSEFIFVRRLRLSAVSVSLPSPFVRRLQLIVRRLCFSAVSVCLPSSADCPPSPFLCRLRLSAVFSWFCVCRSSTADLPPIAIATFLFVRSIPSSADFALCTVRQLVICLVSAVSLHTVFTVVHDPLFSAAKHCFVSCWVKNGSKVAHDMSNIAADVIAPRRGHTVMVEPGGHTSCFQLCQFVGLWYCF